MKTIQIFALIFVANLIFTGSGFSQSWFGDGIKGEGSLVTENLNLSRFDAIGLSINAEVYLTQGSQSVKIEAQKNIIDNIETEVDGKYWKIKFKENVKKHEPIKIWISIPELTSVAVSGSGDVVGKSTFKTDDLKLTVSGSGNISLDANSSSLRAAISGSGDMNLGGSTGDCDLKISGSGDMEAGGLETRTCNIKISGSGDASVHVNDSLEVSIAGSGGVVYSGNPKVRSKISGSGDVTAKR